MTYTSSPSRKTFLAEYSSKILILITGAASLIYFAAITFLFSPGNAFLFTLVIVGEVFHTWQALTYLYTVWDMKHAVRVHAEFTPHVDVFITVAGEPTDIVRTTVTAARDMHYPNHTVYILNDGFVAGKDNWQEIEALGKELRVTCFTRQENGGAKAGNINNAIGQTKAPYIVIFDADHVPYPDFLEKTMPYFVDQNMGFVQTPQYYKNAYVNRVTRAAWEQQELFYGPICRGKNRLNAATMCGTNMVISREALSQVGGMCTESIAEDFATGMFIHEKGWNSFYLPEVLAEGLAPEDFLSYTKQQFRWARGALDVIFKYNVIMRKGLTLAQKIQYLSAVTFFLSGIVVAINILLPIVFLFTGLIPIEISSMLLAVIFLPYILLSVYNLSVTSNFQFTFIALSFAMSGFWIHFQALWAAITGTKNTFSVTSKTAIKGNFPLLILPHISYIVLFVVGFTVAVMREGLSASVVNNTAWALFSIGVFVPFMRAAMPHFSLKKAIFGLLRAPARRLKHLSH
ncbi:MAG: glycosyltransferase [Patescibacteria group bacterium]